MATLAMANPPHAYRPPPPAYKAPAPYGGPAPYGAPAYENEHYVIHVPVHDPYGYASAQVDVVRSPGLSQYSLKEQGQGSSHIVNVEKTEGYGKQAYKPQPYA